MNNNIYPLQTYQTTKEHFEKDVFNGTIEQIVEELKQNKGYNIRIDPTKPCILFGDFDHCTKEEFNSFLEMICDEFDCELHEISYTESKKQNEYSYHWSIPTTKTLSPIELSKIFSTDEYKKFRSNPKKIQLDISIYTTKFLRLPNQTNKDKPKEHKIINGKMEDFIVEYTKNIKYTWKCPEEEIKEKEVIQKPKQNNDDIVNEIKNCLQCLDASCYESWSKVALIINNELGGDGLNILHEWSQQSDNYDYNKVTKFYNNIKSNDNGLKIGTLKMMAKNEDPDLYKKLFNKKNTKPNSKFVDFKKEWSTGYLADVFKLLYSDTFLYSNGKLYNFNKVYWKTDDKNRSIINNFVDSTFYNYLLDELYIFDKNANDRNDEKHCNLIHSKRKHIETLRNIKPRQNLIDDIIQKITNNDIQFDENAYLFAFENKIYDLQKGEFIEPKSSQYISMTSGHKFIEPYDVEEEQAELNKKIELNKLIDTIFPQPEIKKLYLTILSTGLDGLQLGKFVLANGSGGNGKGLLNELVQYLLGHYSYVLPANILLGAIKTGCSNPELANMNNKRFVIAREPDRNLLFNCATIKEFTGGDEINARSNYSDNTKTNLKLTMILECNDKPKLNETTDALSRRIIDIPFKNRFVDKSTYDELDEEDKKTTFLINPYYKTKEFKNEYKQALFLILAEHYKDYYDNKQNLSLPKEILERNKDYLKNSDELLNWFDDTFEKTNNNKDIIKLKIVYEAFKSSEYFNNLNKVQKRQNNYKNFIEKLQNNMFLKKCIKENSSNVYVLTSYKTKVENNDEEDDDEDKIPNGLDAL